MIELKNICKKYNGKEAVKDISFSIKKGEIVGFLGPNGAGKSTTMNIITGYIKADKGQVLIEKDEISLKPNLVKKRIGYLPEQPPLYLDMTVYEYLDFIFNLKKINMPRKEHIETVCNLTKTEELKNRLIKNLSKGYKQRVGIAQALLGEPDVLILDEPTVGLDPAQIIEIRNLIKEIGKNHTVILSSHTLSEVQAVCQRILIINKGQIIADKSCEKLYDNDSEILILEIDGEKQKIRENLESINGIFAVEFLQETEPNIFKIKISSRKIKNLRHQIFKCLSEKNLPLISSYKQKSTLEEIFLKLTKI